MWHALIIQFPSDHAMAHELIEGTAHLTSPMAFALYASVISIVVRGIVSFDFA